MSRGTTYFLWLAGLFGLCGLHRFYTGRPLSGLVWLLTLGLCLVGQFVDLFLIEGMVRDARARAGGAPARPNALGAAAATVPVRERIVVRAPAKVNCSFCDTPNPGDAQRCRNCMAWL